MQKKTHPKKKIRMTQKISSRHHQKLFSWTPCKLIYLGNPPKCKCKSDYSDPPPFGLGR